jgi:predicted esterase
MLSGTDLLMHNKNTSLFISALSIGFFSTLAHGDYMNIDCIGPEKAGSFIVYAHGWDSPEIGSHERLNRQMLKDLGDKHNLRFALPRGDGRCSSGRKQCWINGSKAAIQKNWNRVATAAKKCFPKGSDFGLMGFSNGGNFVYGAYYFCPKPQAQWYMAFGAGGLSYIHGSKLPKCGPLLINIGNKDVTFNRTQAFYRRIRPYSKQVRYEIFSGGHIIHEARLVSDLIKLGYIKPN